MNSHPPRDSLRLVIRELDLATLKRRWSAVFASNDPFPWPFHDGFVWSGVFYPTEGYHLSQCQFTAIIDAARALGEDVFDVSVVEGDGAAFLERDSWHWQLDRPTYDEYRGLELPLENAIFSRTGRWGLLVSHEMHAIVGGSAEFGKAVCKAYGDCDEDLQRLRAEWGGNPRGAWIAEMEKRVGWG